jgi:hypothetical protein
VKKYNGCLVLENKGKVQDILSKKMLSVRSKAAKVFAVSEFTREGSVGRFRLMQQNTLLL